MAESWQEVVGFEKLYLVSERGKVLKIEEHHCVPLKASKRKALRYQRVTLQKDGVRTVHTVHSLVATAFLGPPKEGMEVNHIDSNPFNNRLENLEWVTHRENIEHALSQGRLGRDEKGKFTRKKRV